MDILFFLRCAETAIALMAMTMSFGVLHQHSGLRLAISVIILTANCIFLTVVYQYIGAEAAKKIHIQMIVFIWGGTGIIKFC